MASVSLSPTPAEHVPLSSSSSLTELSPSLSSAQRALRRSSSASSLKSCSSSSSLLSLPLPSTSPPSSPASSSSDLPFVSSSSKREYLLAQIRQKDAIIESLLKQVSFGISIDLPVLDSHILSSVVSAYSLCLPSSFLFLCHYSLPAFANDTTQLHNPYIATPLSIASYRMATSPSDATNRNIIAWLDRLQASVRSGADLDGLSHYPSFSTKAKSKGFNSANPNFASNSAFEESPDEDQEPTENDGDDAEDGEVESGVLPDASVPLGLIANLSLSNNKGREKRAARNGENGPTPEEELEDLDDDNVGVANASYFMPGPATDLSMRAQLIEQHSPPEILIHGLVVPEDVDKLFEIFYARVNPFVGLLDPKLHTPASTFARFCAISSRYYPEKSEIYPIAMHFAKHSAATALIDGWKSVELCQAYILMSIYAVPARKWEEDRSWLYTGLAIRLATDLNLHQVPNSKAHKMNEKQERELLNRTRVWMICFNLDRSTATQYGKPSTIKDDNILRHGGVDWYKKSPYNSSYDIHMCCYTALLRLVAQFHDEIFSDPMSPTGLNKHVDFRTVTINYDAKLTRFTDEWNRRFADGSDPNDRKCALRWKLLPSYVAYSRLVMFSFGFQQAYQRGLQCLESAKAVVRAMVEGLAPTGFMRYAPDGHFIFASFASAFLLKLLRPEFSQLMVKEEENQVFDLIGRLIQTLSSPEIAIDDRHTPKLYARFLAGLLSKHRRDGATVGRLHPQPPPVQQVSSSTSSEYGAPSGTSSTFTMSPMAGAGNLTPDHGYVHYVPQHQAGKMATPIYRPEATYTGQIQYSADLNLGTSLPDEDQMLAAMQALKNPAWWDNMMMPGFSWPESAGQSPRSNTSNGSQSLYQHSLAGAFPPLEVAQFVV
ncbi:hypothetical protein GGX14DRAFT_627532 [Mycena pura]|uniref:Xylanolytic transcriptional activator regulatory domain-containing protein n=1 Tax=Mycena pura TaxID=153505 RepID=A0AAD6YR26_9AGAR|nr:hypothetical protein GGX14DRAFT_627532 [Mycena pura]